MKNTIKIALAFSLFLITACKQNSKAQNNEAQEKTTIESTDLSPQEFQNKINADKNALVLDVRTLGEFSGGHLADAKNIDFTAPDFQANIEKLDKSKSVYVYCLSGGRSKRAADEMRKIGFSKVYELDGGMMNWRSNNLPETTDATSSQATKKSMSLKDFQHEITSDKTVLVDFYADWCEPCKRMKPYIDEISTTMSDKVKVLRINADENKELCKELKVNALPVLQVYKNKKIVWQNLGFVDKETVLQKLK